MTMHRGVSIAGSLLALIVVPAMAQVPNFAPRRPQFRPLRPHSTHVALPTTPALEPQASLSPYVGLIINLVDVVIAPLGAGFAEGQPRLLSVVEGSPFDLSVPPKILAELEASGRFANARIEVERAGAGVRVIVKASERGIVDRVSITIDNGGIDRDALARELGILPGADFELQEWAAATERVRRALQHSGFADAKVEASLQPALIPRRFILILRIVAGAPTLLKRRDFVATGAPAASIARFVSTYQVGTGDRADESALTNSDTQLENKLRAVRYFDAHVTHDVGLDGGEVALRVNVNTGARYELVLRGNSSIDSESLIGSLALDRDTADRNPAQFGESMATYYRKRGFSDVRVRSAISGQRTDPVRYVVLTIDEGARAKVHSRTYPCLEPTVIASLKGGGPRSERQIGTEIDSFLEEELPGSDLIAQPHPVGTDLLLRGEATKRAIPLDLDASKAFDATTYSRAIEHVQELYRNEGYLHARVGPLNVVRATCKGSSPPGACDPVPLPAQPRDLCVYDQTGLPLESPPFPEALTCTPNVARGVRCASRLDIVIPIKIGPQSTLYDVAFTGVRAFSHRQVGGEAALPFGEPANLVTIEAAARKLTDFYRDEGYPFAEVKYALEESDDHTRVRVRFDVSEGDLVYVRRVEVRGLNHTKESIVRRRITLRAGLPFRANEARRTEEAIATLGPFTSVNVAMEDPFVAEREKTIIISVVERVPQYIEVRPGFSTGEGVRGFVEYGHRNLFGAAIGLTARGQVSYLPDPLVPDTVLEGFKIACTGSRHECDRVGRRITLSLLFPEIGLGSLMTGQVDFIHARDIQRDFVLQKFSAVPTVAYRPRKNVLLSLSQSAEHNTAVFYRGDTSAQYLSELQKTDPDAALALGRLLRVPDGQSLAFATRAAVSLDNRDDAFNTHSGTHFATSVEFVNWHSLEANADPSIRTNQGRFFRLTQTASAYVPLAQRVTLAVQLRLGENLQLQPSRSTTYPDRMFFMGGVDSMRGWLQDSFVPYEFDKQLVDGTSGLTLANIPTRGGDFMFNPRAELRFPIRFPVDGVVFADVGNLWSEASNVFEMPFQVRVASGVGIRLVTPVGPLVLDYGFNLTRRFYESPGALQFTVGLF
jgi:outer membrane protein assembly factor BamA